MLFAQIVACCERRWREADLLNTGDNTPWGSMNVIWMGDMLQLPPPSRFFRPLYYDCVSETSGGAEFDEQTDRLAGVRIFRQFKKMELKTQNRARKDRGHKQRIHRMRTSDNPIDEDMLKSLKPLSTQDMKDEKWHFAPIVVTSNVERTLINKSQVMRFARSKGLPVLTWVDPLCNAPCTVDIVTDEKMDPSARRYFVLGAPCFIGENLNSSVTGIVNGTPGWLHSLSWDEGIVPHQFAVTYAPGELVEVPVPHTINVLRKRKDKTTEVVPMIAKRVSSDKGDATLQRMRHPVELGFCVTFHKIQGQTVDRIILALHPRSSCQLLSMSFEMLYVALTRVRSAEDIRIMFCPIKGLQHLQKLKRPPFFDAWLKAYNNHGMWDAAELSRQAEIDKNKAMRTLRSSRPFNKYTIKMIKPLLQALGIQVKNAPGKKYPRQAQYRDALYPVWVEAKLSRSKKKNTSYSSKNSPEVSKMTRTTAVRKRNIPQSTVTSRPITPQLSSNTTTITPTILGGRTRHRRRRLRARLKSFTQLEQQIIQRSRRTLRNLRRNSINDQQLRCRAWAKDVPEVGYISRRSACAWARPGLMLNDTALYSVALHLTQGSLCHFVDPLLIAHQHLLNGSSTSNLLDMLCSGKTLALPFNDPNKHWWMVFALLSSDGKTVQLTHRNSCAHWDGMANESIDETKSLLTRLMRSPQYNVNKHGPFEFKIIRSVSPPRQRQINSCGIHCCAHVLLAGKGQIFHSERTFDSNFIDNLRDRALLYYHRYRVTTNRVIVIRNGDSRIHRESTTTIKPHKREAPSEHTDGSHQSKRARQGLFRDLCVHRKYISPIQLGVKKIECRPRTAKRTYQGWKVGDVITFSPSGKSRRGDLPCLKSIIRVERYPNFRRMLQKEGVSACLPGLTTVDEAVIKYRSFHKSYPALEKKYGVIAFELGPWKPDSNRQ